MRKHQYRGKCKLLGKWMYGSLVIKKTGRVYINTTEVFPETVGELTGLPDKNGKDLYEGDIVHCYSNPFVFEIDDVQQDEVENGIIEFVEGGFRVCFKWRELPAFYHINDLEQIEIIGNIHDDLDLLK